jgi:recombinational DNA repair ATPase RecF
VLLLDDILSEMDERRRDAVLAGLGGFDQVWITATAGSALPAAFLREATAYSVAAGVVVSSSMRRPLVVKLVED